MIWMLLKKVLFPPRKFNHDFAVMHPVVLSLYVICNLDIFLSISLDFRNFYYSVNFSKCNNNKNDKNIIPKYFKNSMKRLIGLLMNKNSLIYSRIRIYTHMYILACLHAYLLTYI
jgi:hypothetical protein